jgi:hypothetical protein
MASHLNNKVLATCLTAFSGLLLGCPFQVTSPEPAQTNSQEFRINDNSQIEIVVTFNAPVDHASVMPGVNVILETEQNPSADIRVTPGSAPSMFTLTTDRPYQDLLGPTQRFSLHLRGDGDNPIRSRRGVRLDGNKDGSAGGNYMTSFLLVN